MTAFSAKAATRETQRDGVASDYWHFMIRELLIWLVGVPVPVATIIGFFVL